MFAALASALILAGCSSTKRVPPGEHLLIANEIAIDSKQISKDDLNAIIKQKPNKKVLGTRFYLTLHNIPDPAGIPEKRAKKDAGRDRKNERRAAKGKKAKPYSLTTAEWLREVIGEAPVLFDSTLMDRSSDQMELFLNKEGFFDAVVEDSVSFSRNSGRAYHKPKARAIYGIRTGRPYTLCTIAVETDDPAIRGYVQEDWNRSLLQPGARFDADVLDAERTRITEQLKQLGYLFFTRDLVTFDADTSAGDHEIDLTVKLQRMGRGVNKELRNTPEGTYYFLNEIVIDMRRRGATGPNSTADTLRYKDHTFLYKGRPEYRPEALLGAIFLNPEERYQQTANDRTYRRLTGLRTFDRVDITYDTAHTGVPNRVDARIGLMPSKTQFMALEGFGTNRGGFLGTSLSLSYKHKNLFRTMGTIQAQMTFGFEAQQQITGSGSSETGGQRAPNFFNTIEIGPEVTIRFPQFLVPVPRDRFSRSAAPRTILFMQYNFQQRPDYTRNLIRLSLGYEWNESLTKTWGIFPIDVNVIQLPFLSPDFEDYLIQANDPVLTDSYTDHLIIGGRIQFTLNTQNANIKRRNNVYYRGNFQPAGNLLQLFNNAFDAPLQTRDDGTEFYTLGGVRYAQFLKLDNELRYYRYIHDRSSLVFRMGAGVGVPLTNLNVLPFESSFFVGGANGLRAWRARTVGPGSYAAPLEAYDRIGEVRLEGNAEYRFGLDRLYRRGLVRGPGEHLVSPGGHAPARKRLQRKLPQRIGGGYGIRAPPELRFLPDPFRPRAADQGPCPAARGTLALSAEGPVRGGPHRVLRKALYLQACAELQPGHRLSVLSRTPCCPAGTLRNFAAKRSTT